MRDLAIGVLVVLLGSVAVDVAPAQAETRTPPEATQHALDELANCRAQNRRDAGQICPTETATPSPTPRPTSTPQAAATATLASKAATATPLPVMPVGGNGYVRPLDDHWLEIALQQGRWAVYQADDCGTRVDPWVNVVTQVQDTGEVDLISETADCGLVVEQWLSDAPCSVNDQGVCDVSADASFWDMLSHLPTPTPTPVPSAAPTRAVPQPQARQAAAAAAPQAQARTVVQTVVVVVTPESTDTPELAATSTPTPTATRATATPTRTPSVRPSATATGTPTPMVVVAQVAPPAPPLATFDANPPRLLSDANRLWLFGLVIGAAALGAAAFWLTRGRRRYVL